MSGNGKPTLTRSKRLKHFHTDHTTAYNGSETIHVKTTLTASVDGDYTINADEIILADPVTLQATLDLGNNKITNLKNVLRSEKITITTANLSTASRFETVPLFRASPGDTVYDSVGNARVSFKKGASTDLLRIAVGDAGTPTGFLATQLATPIGWAWDGTTGEKGSYVRTLSGSLTHKTYTTATIINAYVTASLWYGSSLDGGEADIYIDVMSRA